MNLVAKLINLPSNHFPSQSVFHLLMIIHQFINPFINTPAQTTLLHNYSVITRALINLLGYVVWSESKNVHCTDSDIGRLKNFSLFRITVQLTTIQVFFRLK